MQTEGRASLNGADEVEGSGRRRRIVLFAVVALVVFAADVASKIAAMAHLSDREPIPLLGGFLTLHLVRNPGAAFGLAEGYTVALSLVALGVVVVVLRLSRRLGSTPWAIAFGLLLGGALGNLADRIFREPGPLRGHVVDFLELPNWPVFNLADSSICLAAGLIIVMALRGRSWDGTVDSARTGRTRAQEQPADLADDGTRDVPATRVVDSKPAGTTE